MGKYNKDLPDMPLSLYSSGINMEALQGTAVEARLIKPYYNKHWDGEYAFYYTPPDRVTDKPALTINGKVAHFSHRIFNGYALQALVELRTVFSNVLNDFSPTRFSGQIICHLFQECSLQSRKDEGWRISCHIYLK